MQINQMLLGLDSQAAERGLLVQNEPIYYADGFRQEIEDHLFVLRARGTPITVDPGTAYRYEYNYYGLLFYQQVEPQYHWISLRMMGFTSPEDWREQNTYFLLPDYQYVAQMNSHYRTTQRM